MGESLLTFHDLAAHLKVARKTLERLIEEDPDFPRPIQVRRSDRWIVADVDRWLLRQQVKRDLEDRAGPKVVKRGQSGPSAPRGDLPARRRRDRD